ncbi:hypothetical protein [Arsukibacterium indicum]|uniref:DUF2306 domain-containing protein n=1 Tax=Arsukibacterium indicum TaxID=2848612 RepID=A0ABS6MMU8_9GAMM|nr:hypothetical protein [Arsukibacterium indicum]MBV2130060.1 hypothetical protein [Arsukibacterium indicum]
MLAIHTTLLYMHIFLGAIALMVFWLPIFARKGGKLHIVAGKVFYTVMLVVSGSGIIMSLIGLSDPVGIYINSKQLSSAQIDSIMLWRIPFTYFLLLLSLLTWVTVRHAIGVLRAKANRAMLRSWQYQAPVLLMFPAAVFVGWQGIDTGMPLLIIFAVVSLITATTICLYVYRATVAPRAWIIEHFGSMVGAGIAVYTAFFAAGGRRVLSQWLPGEWQLVSWLAAPVIGVTVLIAMKGYYQRKYKVQHNKALQQG